MAATRVTKPKAAAKRKKNRNRRESNTKSRGARGEARSVDHVGQEPSDGFLKEITKHAPWEVWAHKLASRKSPTPLHKLMPRADGCPLVWSTGEDTPQGTIQLLDWLYALRRRRRDTESPGDWSVVAEEWIESLDVRPVTQDVVLEAIAWAHGLPRLAVRLPAVVWSSLVAQLVSLAAAAVETGPLDEADADRLTFAQLVRGELPLTLAYVFPKVESCQQLSVPARQAIEEGLLASLDGEGFLHSRLTVAWPQLLACWTRCAYLVRQVKGGSISYEAQMQFEWLIRQSLRCLRADGTQMLSPEPGQFDSYRGLIRSALDVGGDEVDRELFAVMRGRNNASDSKFQLPLAGDHSEWAELAVLRADWTRTSPYLAMSFGNRGFESEFAVGSRRIWQGRCLPQLRVDGTALKVDGDWEELCWSSDKDMDYIELEIKLSKGWRLQRQFLLGRADQFLFIADVLLGPRRGQLEYRLELPIDSRLDCLVNDETTEVQFASDRAVAWAHPLALSEWKTDSRRGKFNGRVLQQNATGTGLYAPIFFDLSAKRMKKPRTWRQLTIGEDLKIVSNDVATAYRIRIGSRQWVIYRSLARKGNRTLLGQNLMNEFVVARFQKDGELRQIIEIE